MHSLNGTIRDCRACDRAEGQDFHGFGQLYPPRRTPPRRGAAGIERVISSPPTVRPWLVTGFWTIYHILPSQYKNVAIMMGKPGRLRRHSGVRARWLRIWAVLRERYELGANCSVIKPADLKRFQGLVRSVSRHTSTQGSQHVQVREPS
jgi:hypothetical protein